MRKINDRNDALAALTGKLKIEIDKGNHDANLLVRIKDAVDKANQTVTEVKALVDQLTNTDASTKSKIKALIDTLGNISSIFSPQDT